MTGLNPPPKIHPQAEALNDLAEEILAKALEKGGSNGLDKGMIAMGCALAATKLLYRFSGSNDDKARQAIALMCRSSISAMEEMIRLGKPGIVILDGGEG